MELLIAEREGVFKYVYRLLAGFDEGCRDLVGVIDLVDNHFSESWTHNWPVLHFQIVFDTSHRKITAQ